jgi:hypothetical protein
MENPPVSIALEELGVPHKIFRHDAARPVNSFEQAASDRGQRASQVVRSILFRIAEDEYIMVGRWSRANFVKICVNLGRRVSLATEDGPRGDGLSYRDSGPSGADQLRFDRCERDGEGNPIGECNTAVLKVRICMP